MKSIAYWLALCAFVARPFVPSPSEAPAAFDGLSNGLVDEATHQADRTKFDEVENISDGLGPLYNAQACRECHQNPVSGGLSQITELRAGHRDRSGRFQNPSVPIADGAAIITGRTLINDRAICPNAEFPKIELQERVPDSENIRTFRTSLNLLGDGFVEAVPDEALLAIARRQCRETRGKICGKAISVPILEVTGKYRIGRFGWKDQHASLLSFAADAYLNEMGITSRLLPSEITPLCDTVKDPEDKIGEDGLSDIDRFARFVRATKAPPRDLQLAETPEARRGSELYDSIGCATCHVRQMETAPAGTSINGGAFTVPAALGNKIFYPFGDFLLHDVGTGDGIALATVEHFGAYYRGMQSRYYLTANRMRTAPLWGVRTRTRLMHDGNSLTFRDAILRHRAEAAESREKFLRLPERKKNDLISFLKSL